MSQITGMQILEKKLLKETRKCTVMYRAQENTLVYQRIMHETERLSTKNEESLISEILGTIFQPRALTCKIPASQERFYVFYNPPINKSQDLHILRVVMKETCIVVH